MFFRVLPSSGEVSALLQGQSTKRAVRGNSEGAIARPQVSALELMLYHDSRNLLGHKYMVSLIDRKWNSFAKYYYRVSLAMHVPACQIDLNIALLVWSI